LTLVEAADTALNGPDEVKCLNQLEAEHDNLREVLRWSMEAQTKADARTNSRAHLALSLVAVLWKFWMMRGYQREGFAHMCKILARPELATQTATRLHVLNGAGFLGVDLGEYLATRPLLEEALAIAAALEDKTLMANTLHVLAGSALSQGDLTDTRAYAEQELALRRELGSTYDTAQALIALGHVPLLQGEYPEAQALFEEGIALLRITGITNLLAYSLRQLAMAFLLKGDYEQATAMCRESLLRNLELQSRSGMVACLAAFVNIALARGQTARAAQLSGAVEALLKSGSTQLLPIDRNAHDASLISLRAQLDEATLAVTWELGRSMSMEQAIAFVLEENVMTA
jgi:tetratricopeptide (TPR) repeat protein